jgi:hypothetical protein
MTSIAPPICGGCTRRIGTLLEPKCNAYPDGIPTPIVLSQYDHRQPFAGDNGKTFDPKTKANADYAESLFPSGARSSDLVPLTPQETLTGVVERIVDARAASLAPQINITNVLPEQPAPVTNLTVESPVINVTTPEVRNEITVEPATVEPTPITITNEVSVEPTPVSITNEVPAARTTTKRVVRDAEQRITAIVEDDDPVID